MAISTVKLGDVANVRTILLFRDRAPDYRIGGNAYALSIKDIATKSVVQFHNLQEIEVGHMDLEDQLVEGDILMPARGEYYPARMFTPTDRPVFPVGQINVIRATKEVGPLFLAWFLNQPQIQNRILDSLTGSSIRALSKSRLNDIDIPLLAQDSQKTINAVLALNEEKTILLEKLSQIEKDVIDAYCNKLIGPWRGYDR